MKIQVNVCTQSNGFAEFDDLDDLETFVRYRDDEDFTWTPAEDVSMLVSVVNDNGETYTFKDAEDALNFMNKAGIEP